MEKELSFLPWLQVFKALSQKDVVFLLRVVEFMPHGPTKHIYSIKLEKRFHFFENSFGKLPIVTDSVGKYLSCRIERATSDGLLHCL